MEKDIFDSMCNLELSPEDFITLMFERTDEDGILYVPALYRTPAGWELGVPETYDNESYRCKMNWNLFKYEKVLKKFQKHLDIIKQIGNIKKEDREKGIETKLNGELQEFWNKFLENFDTGDIDTDKIDDISERIDITAFVKYIAKKIAAGEEVEESDRKSLAEYVDVEVSKEERNYYDKYINAIWSDCEKRVGKSVAAYDVVIFSRRLCKLLELCAPTLIIQNETHALAEAFVLHECCTFYEIVDNRIRLRIEQIENMDEEELDMLYRPQKMNSRKSMAPLFVYSILKEKSNSKKHLRQQEIINELAKHPYEILIERKALSRIIHNLVDSTQYGIFQDKTGVWIDQE